MTAWGAPAVTGAPAPPSSAQLAQSSLPRDAASAQRGGAAARTPHVQQRRRQGTEGRLVACLAVTPSSRPRWRPEHPVHGPSPSGVPARDPGPARCHCLPTPLDGAPQLRVSPVSRGSCPRQVTCPQGRRTTCDICWATETVKPGPRTPPAPVAFVMTEVTCLCCPCSPVPRCLWHFNFFPFVAFLEKYACIFVCRPRTQWPGSNPASGQLADALGFSPQILAARNNSFSSAPALAATVSTRSRCGPDGSCAPCGIRDRGTVISSRPPAGPHAVPARGRQAEGEAPVGGGGSPGPAAVPSDGRCLSF